MKELMESFAKALGMDMDVIRKNVAAAEAYGNDRLKAVAELMDELIGGTGEYNFKAEAQETEKAKTEKAAPKKAHTYNRDEKGRFVKKDATPKKAVYRDARGRYCSKEKAVKVEYKAC